ncbi:MAG: hypothetical protein EPN22_12795 [Nitrospirae bacterium]|nr:MAG: hypothetical protein EPN22_12795 [Nitrospirota bacterium]
MKKSGPAFFAPFFLFFIMSYNIASALTGNDIETIQKTLANRPPGERIAVWAEKFIGTPYDPDPLGEYVSKAVIVADERVDCMYLTFRAVELALGTSPEESIRIALDKRFHGKGIVRNETVMNYEERFEYGEDMILSGKWGKDITASIGKTVKIKGSRGIPAFEILTPQNILKGADKLRDGDIIFLVKAPHKRKRNEIVGHIGIIKTGAPADKGDLMQKSPASASQRNVHIIHAGGRKGIGGSVKKVLLQDYIKKMPFVGAKITRFDGS